MSKRALGLLIGLVLTATAAPAQAATVRLVDDPPTGDRAVSFIAGNGELNSVFVDGPNQGRMFVQSTTPVDAVPPCWSEILPGLGYAGRCPADGVDHVLIELGDGADHFSTMFNLPAVVDGGTGADAMYGGRGTDHLIGGPGQDSMHGSYGADRISARDGFVDEVTCGPGVDTVEADVSDSIAADCELRGDGPPPDGRPDAVTVSANDVTDSRATVHGVANPRGLATTVRFEYGTNAEYGSTTPSQLLEAADRGLVVTARLEGLRPATTYHFRLVATSSAGTSYGDDVTFTTLPASSPPPRICRVPRLVGLPLADARRRLVRAGCRLGTVRTARVRSRRRGIVLSQSVRAGSSRPHGTRVNVVVNAGRRR